MKVLGIDPGTLNMGWGFIESDKKGNIVKVASGTLVVPSRVPFLERLSTLQSALSEILTEHQPDWAVIEQIFLGKNVDSAFKLGHIRGICAVECQSVGAQVVEYGARTVKKQITGSGQADKQVVQNFVRQHLQLKKAFRTLDESDALALALCHVLQGRNRIIQQGMGRP